VAGEKNLKLENGVPPRLQVTSDTELLALVLQNLVGNAIKYSSAGTVRVHTEHEPPAQRWRLMVSDQGAGIAPDKLATLFEAFSRGETFGQKGVGLGLTIAYEAARVLGADLHVQSEVGKGTTFSISLPQAQS
jgi:signal transduction histidine kinase